MLMLDDLLGAAPTPRHDESKLLKKKVTNHMKSMKFPLNHLEGCPKSQHSKPT
jgi:hypothetical protein